MTRISFVYLNCIIQVFLLFHFVQKFLNNIANYIPNAWNMTAGCIVCQEWAKELPEDKSKWPTVQLSVYVETLSPFLAEMLEKVSSLDYPADKLSLWVHNAVSTTYIALVGGMD